MPVHHKDATQDRLRLPRLGIIRLGTKETRYRNDGSEYSFPKRADHFVLNHEPPDNAGPVRERYGDAPTVLEPVLFPGEDEDVVASHWLRMYSQTWGLTCIGDGLKARRRADAEVLKATGEARPAGRNTKTIERVQVDCPCPFLDSKDCRETMYLRFVLPEVEGLGVWQIATGSRNSILNVQGTLGLLKSLVGRISGIPLRLSFMPQTVTSDEAGRQEIHVLRLDILDFSLTSLRKHLATMGQALPALIDARSRPGDQMPEDSATAEGDPLPTETEQADYYKGDELETPDPELPADESAEDFEAFMEGAPTGPEATTPLPRDLSLIHTVQDLCRACFEDFKLQPTEVANLAGYSHTQQLAGLDLQEVYHMVSFHKKPATTAGAGARAGRKP